MALSNTSVQIGIFNPHVNYQCTTAYQSVQLHKLFEPITHHCTCPKMLWSYNQHIHHHSINSNHMSTNTTSIIYLDNNIIVTPGICQVLAKLHRGVQLYGKFCIYTLVV